MIKIREKCIGGAMIVFVCAFLFCLCGICTANAASSRVYNYAESTAASSWSTNTTYQTKTSLTITPESNSTYLILSSWMMQGSSVSYQVKTKLTRTTATTKDYNELIYLPKDTTDYLSAGTIGIDTFVSSTSAVTYAVQYGTNSTAGVARIKEAKLIAFKLTSADAYAQSESRTTVATTAFTDKTTLTFTPSTAGDYIVLASATVDGSSTSYDTRVQLTVDGTAYNTSIIEPTNSAVRYSWMAMKQVNFSAAAHNIKIQYSSESAAATAGIAHARIVVLRADEFYSNYYNESIARSAAAATSYATKAGISTVTEAADHLIIGNMTLDGSSESYSTYGRLINDSSSYGESIREPKDTSNYFSYFNIKKASLSSGSHTWSLQYKSESTAATAGVRSAAVVVLQLADEIPSISATLGKSTDGWSGAVPVYATLSGGLAYADYPYARVQVVTPAAETYYANLTWDAVDARFEGVIYVGSWYCPGCADPNTGTYTVTAQLDNNSDFSSIDYSDASTKTFTTAVTRRWNAISASAMGNGTEISPTWNTDHWDYAVNDLNIGGTAAAMTNVAFAIPFHPITSDISNITVSLGGTVLSEGTPESTTDCWYWNSDEHTLYVQKASVAASTYYTVDLTFDSDTDLWATRIDRIYTYNMGDRLFYNGFLIGNKYIATPMLGGGHEGSGMQIEAQARDASDDNDVNVDCMERIAVHTDNVITNDSSGHYAVGIKWKQNEWKDYIVSENNDTIQIQVHSDPTASTGWIQYLNNGISAERLQTYYAGKRYIKNEYTFTNNSSSTHTLPVVWGREQWLGEDRNTNDQGRYAGDTVDRTVESTVAISTLPNPWFMAYDTGEDVGMGVIFEDDNLTRYGYFLSSPAVLPTNTTGEWVNYGTEYRIDDNDSGTTANNIFFDKVYSDVASGASVDLKFYQWAYDTDTSYTDLESAISADEAEINS